MPEDLRQIERAEFGETVLHPVALLVTLVMILCVVSVNRRWVLIPMLIVGAFITSMQRLVVGSLDFPMMRLLLLGVYARAILRRDTERVDWTSMDAVYVAYVAAMSVAYIALWRTSSAVVNRMGFAFDAFLAYFAVRLYFRTIEQVRVLMRGFSVIIAIVAVAMTLEQLTQYNVFSVFGGVRAVTLVREGNLRAQGAFSHSILAGTFGAVFIPLSWALRSQGARNDRILGTFGIVGALFIVMASSSSGPLLSLAAALFGILWWRYRRHTRSLVRWSLFGILCLHLYMDAPVWHLLARIDLVGGSTGYHRYALIDRTIQNFREWALVGVYTTGHWGWGLNDVTNMYVLQAVNGGLVTLVLFIFLIRDGFRRVRTGIAASVTESEERLNWSWGVVLFVHCVSFVGVSYFGQMTFFWYLTLGVLATLPQSLGIGRRLRPVLQPA